MKKTVQKEKIRRRPRMSAKSQEKPVEVFEDHKTSPSSDDPGQANGLLPQDDSKLESIQKKIAELKQQLRAERKKRSQSLIERHTLTLPIGIMNHLKYTALQTNQTLGQVITQGIKNEIQRLGIEAPPEGKKFKLRVGRRKTK